jgi:hypothetical protein
MSHAILKLLPPENAVAESRGVALAEQYTPAKFWDEHMVPTVHRSPMPGSDWWVHLQKHAHANLTTLQPLAELINEPEFAEFCGTVIETIVRDWHQDDDGDPWEGTAHEFLASFLTGTHRAGLADFADEAGLSPSNTVVVPGRSGPLPNPLALLAGTASDPETGAPLDATVEVFRANGHGDLQLFNVLVPATDPITPDRFRLIDYGRFDHLMPVSRDPVKLTLAVAGLWLPALRDRTALRSNLAELVVDPRNHPASAPVAGYLAVVRRIYDAASLWALKRDMPDEWRRQHVLVLLASALRTVADTELRLADRWWHLEVAALAMRAYIEGGGARAHPTTPPSLTRLPVDTTGPHDVGLPERNEPVAFAGPLKLAFVQRLGAWWEDLADWLQIPVHDRARFTSGNEARSVWEWLEVRDRLGELPEAVAAVGRGDLAELLNAARGE